MKTTRYRVTFAVAVEIDVADEVIGEALKPEWQRDFYKFSRPEDVAGHLAFNVLKNHTNLSSLDGWAHRADSDLKVVSEDWDEEEVERQ